MNDNRMIVDHLRAALLATEAERPFLAYLIQMALIECTSTSQVFQSNANLNTYNEEQSEACEAFEILSQLPLSATQTGIN